MMNTFTGGVFLENIEWVDESGKELVQRLPREGSGEIKFGAQLTVRESQAGILYYQGKACDAFGPGRHTLKTWNLPILTKLLSIPWRGDSPLRAEVYMVSLKYFTDLPWGTKNPVAFRDQELGLIRLRANGVYNIQIVQPVLFINSLVGTMGGFTTEHISSFLRQLIVARLNDYLGETLDTIFNLPGKFDELAEALKNRLDKDFADYGLTLSHLIINSITPPEEVQTAIDDKSRMRIIEDMDSFLKLKAATAMEKAAANQGEAGAGMGMGIGMMLPAMFAATGAASTAAGPGKTGTETTACPDCQNQIPNQARFCPLCGHQQLLLARCSNCGKNLTPKAKFCSQCGTPAEQKKQPVICRGCRAENLFGALFCSSCGERVS